MMKLGWKKKGEGAFAVARNPKKTKKRNTEARMKRFLGEFFRKMQYFAEFCSLCGSQLPSPNAYTEVVAKYFKRKK